MVHMLIIRADGSIARARTEDELARAYRDENASVWIHFDRVPNARDLDFLSGLLGLGELATDHLSRTHIGPRASRFQTYMLTVFYDVTLSDDTSQLEQREVVLLFSTRYLISVLDGASPRIAQVTEHVDRALRRYGVEIASIVFALIESIADHYLQILEDVRQRVDTLEERVLFHEQQEAIGDLYQLRRQLIALRRVIAPEASLIGSREAPNPFVLNPDLQDGALDIKHKLQSALDEIDQDLSLLPNILTTFESLKSDSLNRILKLLTVWSIILTAVALFPTILGISLSREPNVSPYLGYLVSTGMMVLAGAVIWFLFKRRGWID